MSNTQSGATYLTLEVDDLITILNTIKGHGLKIQFNHVLQHSTHPPVRIDLGTESGQLGAKIVLDKAYGNFK